MRLWEGRQGKEMEEGMIKKERRPGHWRLEEREKNGRQMNEMEEGMITREEPRLSPWSSDKLSGTWRAAWGSVVSWASRQRGAETKWMLCLGGRCTPDMLGSFGWWSEGEENEEEEELTYMNLFTYLSFDLYLVAIEGWLKATEKPQKSTHNVTTYLSIYLAKRHTYMRLFTHLSF